MPAGASVKIKTNIFRVPAGAPFKIQRMERVKKTVKNAKVNLLFYFITLVIAFVSRRVFIDGLGDGVMGLNSTIGDMLGYLNLAELGVWAATAYWLYRPIHDGDRGAISEIVSLMGYLYRRIGGWILVAGVALSLFFPLIFAGKDAAMWQIYVAFYVFLAVALMGYFVNYRQILLVADQKNYMVAARFNGYRTVKVLLQMAALYWLTQSYMVWLAIELAGGVAISLSLNRKIDREYPWLKTDIAAGRQLMRKYRELVGKIRQVFNHKVAAIVLFYTDNIVISLLYDFSMVTRYTNYTMIFVKTSAFMVALFDSGAASVGNLIASGDRGKIRRVYLQMLSLRYWIAGVLIIGLYFLTDPVVAWFSKSIDGPVLLDRPVFILMLANIFISILRPANEMFIQAYGKFRDVWAPWTEAALNLAISVAAGYYWGLLGVVLGTTVSTGLIAGVWKPCFLFREGFGEGVGRYWAHVLNFMAGLALTFCVVRFVLWPTLYTAPADYLEWLVNAVVITAVSATVYGAYLLASSVAMRENFATARKLVQMKLRSWRGNKK